MTNPSTIRAHEGKTPRAKAANGADVRQLDATLRERFGPEQGEPPPEPITPEPFDLSRLPTLPKRKRLYGGWLERQYAAVVGGAGGVGKSTLINSVILSILCGRPLLEEAVHEQGLRVMMYNLEDPLDDLYRGLDAAMRLHAIKPPEAKEIAKRLFVLSGRQRKLCVAQPMASGGAIAMPDKLEMIKTLRGEGIDVLTIDPFVKCHRLSENDNTLMDRVMTIWNEIAEEANCAPILSHHFRKGATGDTQDAFRGASAVVDASRAAIGLSKMSAQEADQLGVTKDERRFLIGVDYPKLSHAPPAEDRMWFRLNSITISNGEEVQAVSRWRPQSVFKGLELSLVDAMLDEIDRQAKTGEPYSPTANNVRWAGHALIRIAGEHDEEMDDETAKRMLKDWTRSGMIDKREFQTKARNTRKGLYVNPDKRFRNED